MVISTIVIALLVILDFILKNLFVGIYELDKIEVIIPNILNFGYIRNYGASFGIFQNQQILFLIITVAALVLFGYFFMSTNWKNKKVYSLAFVFLIAGTLGNGIDRLLYGYVIDYIQMPFLPIVGNTVFNLADVLLNAGVALLVIDILIIDTLNARKNKKRIETNTDDKND